MENNIINNNSNNNSENKTEKKDLSLVLKRLLHSRSLKYGTNSLLMIIAVIAVAVLVNVIVDIPDIKWDLTANKLYSLDQASKNLLEKLDRDVTIYALFDETKAAGTDYEEVTELLNLYEKYDRVKVIYVDPVRNPGIINKLDPQDVMGIENYDLVVISSVNGQEKKKRLEYYDLFQTQFDTNTFNEYKIGSNAEQGITGAIKFVTSEKTPVVYFTDGHGEFDVDSYFKGIKEYLEKNNYSVKKLNLLSVSSIPDDAEIVVFLSPKNDLAIKERELLFEYFKLGGKAVFLFDYLASGAELNQFNSLLGEFNVAVNNDKVKELDPQKHLPEDPYTILLNVNKSDIIPESFNTVLQDSRSISILKNPKSYLTTTSLMQTSDKAVSEPVTAGGEVLEGPLNVAVAVENKGFDQPSKILVMGNATFISDSAAQTYGTMYRNGVIFFLQSLHWMFDTDDELIVPTKSYDTNLIYINQMQAVILGIVVTIVVPLIILGVGLFVFMRRRHL